MSESFAPNNPNNLPKQPTSNVYIKKQPQTNFFQNPTEHKAHRKFQIQQTAK